MRERELVAVAAERERDVIDGTAGGADAEIGVLRRLAALGLRPGRTRRRRPGQQADRPDNLLRDVVGAKVFATGAFSLAAVSTMHQLRFGLPWRSSANSRSSAAVWVAWIVPAGCPQPCPGARGCRVTPPEGTLRP
jgi:hypothetical protein